jgi:hypothetical protein
VEFASAQASYAVCEFCRSTVVRQGDVLQRRGSMAEVFEDYSPLRIGATGQMLRNGKPEHFTLVGRLQLKSEAGAWSEWVAAFSDGALGFLSEDNGQFVWSWPWEAEALRNGPFKASDWLLGSQRVLGGKSFTVSSVQNARLVSAQGELAQLPEPGTPYRLVELRSEQGQVLSVDFSVQPPALSLGERVVLDDLRMQGLRDGASLKGEQGRHFNCPKCGAVVPVRFTTTKSLSCPSCGSLVDLSQGIGKELSYAEQNEPVRPAIPLGSKGALEGLQWQVVGFQHRMGTEPSDPDEHFGWEEYLLFNAKRGFTFLVDSTDGWSLVKPATGAPVVAGSGQTATYLGTRYQLKESYEAETNYVVGEFYWRVQRGQKTTNQDFVSGNSLLSMEQSPAEVTWSVGSRIASDAVAKAFKIEDKSALLKRSDVGPLVPSGGPFMDLKFWIFVTIVLVFLALSTCANNCDPNVENCSSTRTSGGSWGGFSSGGGHK